MNRHPNIVLLVVSCSIFFEALDIAIVNLAIPLIQRDFGLAGDTVQWMQTLYVLFYGGFLVVGGKLADTAGRKKVFLAGATLFMLTSLGAGLAPTFFWLSAFRALQGLGAALVMPAAFSIITNTFTEPTARRQAIGIFGSFAAIGSGSGLSVGGLIATYLGWPWMFFINVPVIAVAVVLGYRYITPDETSRPGNTDFASGVLVTAGIGMLTYVVHALGDVRNQALLLAIMIGLTLLCFRVFAKRNRRPGALIDFSLLNHYNTVTAYSTVLLMGAFFTGYLFLISVALQTNAGLSAAEAGLLLFPFSVMSAVVSKKFLPFITRRLSMMQTGIVGMVFMAMGGACLCSALMEGNSLALMLCSAACVTGVGIAVCFMSLNVLVVQEVPEAHHGLAGSVLNTCFFFGSGLGLAALGLVMPNNTMAPIDVLPTLILLSFAIAGVLWLVTRSKRRVAFSQ